MKAVQFAQYGGPEVLRVYEVDDPTPGPADVLVQVKATTVNRLEAVFDTRAERIFPEKRNCSAMLTHPSLEISTQ